jgi:hypothetical protein
MLFARFLGFWVTDPSQPWEEPEVLDPIGVGGLQVSAISVAQARLLCFYFWPDYDKAMAYYTI